MTLTLDCRRGNSQEAGVVTVHKDEGCLQVFAPPPVLSSRCDVGSKCGETGADHKGGISKSDSGLLLTPPLLHYVTKRGYVTEILCNLKQMIM